jgi:ketosteroid isomerase-like protein
MAEKRIAAVRGYFAALSRFDFDGALDLVDPDFVFDYSRSRGPLQGVYRGRAGLREFYDGFSDAFSEVEAFETEIIEVGDLLLRAGGFKARGRVSGIELSAGGATLWSFRGDVPVSAALYQSKEDALADTGGEE